MTIRRKASSTRHSFDQSFWSRRGGPRKFPSLVRIRARRFVWNVETIFFIIAPRRKATWGVACRRARAVAITNCRKECVRLGCRRYQRSPLATLVSAWQRCAIDVTGRLFAARVRPFPAPALGPPLGRHIVACMRTASRWGGGRAEAYLTHNLRRGARRAC